MTECSLKVIKIMKIFSTLLSEKFIRLFADYRRASQLQIGQK